MPLLQDSEPYPRNGALMMSNAPETPTGIITRGMLPVRGEEPSLDETEQVEWAEDAIKNSPVLIRDSLRQLITLDTALLAGSAALLARATLPKGVAAIGMLGLFLSLAIALWSSMPREAQLCPYAPEQVRRFREGNLKARVRGLKWACGFFFASLIAFAAGLLL
jgi:hypothetical protein